MTPVDLISKPASAALRLGLIAGFLAATGCSERGVGRQEGRRCPEGFHAKVDGDLQVEIASGEGKAVDIEASDLIPPSPLRRPGIGPNHFRCGDAMIENLGRSEIRTLGCRQARSAGPALNHQHPNSTPVS